MSDEIGKHAKLKPLCLNDLGVRVSPHPPKNFLKDLHLGCKMFYNFYRKEEKKIWASGEIGRHPGLDSKEELNVLSKRWTENGL